MSSRSKTSTPNAIHSQGAGRLAVLVAASFCGVGRDVGVLVVGGACVTLFAGAGNGGAGGVDGGGGGGVVLGRGATMVALRFHGESGVCASDVVVESGAPHSGQKAFPSPTVVPHRGQLDIKV